MNFLEQSSHLGNASKYFWCSTISFFLLTAVTRSINIHSTRHCCFLRLDTTLPRCTCSVISGSHRQRCHHLSVPRDTPHTHPPCISKPAFQLQAVHTTLRLPLTSNTSDKIILKPTSDSRSPHSSWIMTPACTSCNIVLAVTVLLAAVSRYCIMGRVNGPALPSAPVIVA